MAINDTYLPVKISGDGSTVAFDFDFRVYEEDNLLVSLVDKETDQITEVLEYGTDYTVEIEPLTGDPGGTITLDEAPSADYWVLIESNIPDDQPTSFGVDSKLSEKSIERALDRQCRISQQLSEKINRCLKLPASLAESDISVELPVPSAGKFIAWNDEEDGLENRSGEFTAVDYTGTISAGLYADRPATPSVDDIYIATDTQQLLICFTNAVWSPIVPDGQYFTNLANIPSGAGRIPEANLPLRHRNTVVTLTDGANIATNAALGDHFKVTLGGNRTLDNPTNVVEGQRIVFEFIQDGTGSRTITLGANFLLGVDITAVTLTTTANKKDMMACVGTSDGKLKVVAFMRGYA